MAKIEKFEDIEAWEKAARNFMLLSILDILIRMYLTRSILICYLSRNNYPASSIISNHLH